MTAPTTQSTDSPTAPDFTPDELAHYAALADAHDSDGDATDYPAFYGR